MNAAYIFIETMDFKAVVKHYFGSDEEYSNFQSDLTVYPDSGSVISGAAPLRKIRWGDKRRGMGKRGGLRVIYVHIPDLQILILIDVYGKNDADDLSKNEKKELQQLANQLVTELRERPSEGIS